MIDLVKHPKAWWRLLTLALGVACCAWSVVEIAAAACADHHAQGASVQISQAWSPPAPPTLGIHAGYFSIANHSQTPRVLIAANSPRYEQIDVHRSIIKDGVASMEAVASLPIAAGEQIQFAPGGLHLMMTTAQGKRNEGDCFPITLHFQSGATLTFEMQVTRQAGADHVSTPAMDHSMHTPHQHHGK